MRWSVRADRRRGTESAADENSRSYVVYGAATRLAQGLSRSQLFLVFLVPALITVLEHFIIDDVNERRDTLLFLGSSLAIVVGLWWGGALLQRPVQRDTREAIKVAPGYGERKWPIVALTVGNYATKPGVTEQGGVSPTPEQLAVSHLLDRSGPHHVVLVHSDDTRHQAEALAAAEELIDAATLVRIDPFGEPPDEAAAIELAIRAAADGIGRSVDGDAEATAVVDITGGLLAMSVTAQLAAQLVGCPAHVRTTPNRRRDDGQTVFDVTRAKSIFLEPA